ncbi:MAG: hypothetical protein HOK67_01175 [Deltaproteobacteria bacterium]|nr:hypothetical protein [Deltaproteobacteria bacterium]MBT4263942.1 hypothetical protein [Deltaproteobacteria bacterium]MBT4639885.1 hypothetical protein [Deltaproteobacteria bacterium]MBT6498497.1 hypothetical protein [Deltaproteobacteria bacterium]MBT6611097.1 hypothetical protein [Deltaproteobacteria bacterium]
MIVIEKGTDGSNILRRSRIKVMAIFSKILSKLFKKAETGAGRLVLLTIVLALAGLSRTGFCAVSVQEVKSLFSSAQANFELGLKQQGERKRALMIKSAGQFRSLIRDHRLDNGSLYYNMGNAYYEAGETGKAILSYRRAKRLLPGFSDLQYNLNQARSRLNLSQPTQSWWESIVKGLFFWHYMMKYELRRSMLLIVFSLVWIVLMMMIFKRHVFLRMALIILIALNIGFGGSFLYSYYQLHVARSGVVVKDNTIARKGPGSGYEPFYQKPLSGGTEFTINGTHENWWKIKLPLGDEVWIKVSDAEMI